MLVAYRLFRVMIPVASKYNNICIRTQDRLKNSMLARCKNWWIFGWTLIELSLAQYRIHRQARRYPRAIVWKIRRWPNAKTDQFQSKLQSNRHWPNIEYIGPISDTSPCEVGRWVAVRRPNESNSTSCMKHWPVFQSGRHSTSGV